MSYLLTIPVLLFWITGVLLVFANICNFRLWPDSGFVPKTRRAPHNAIRNITGQPAV